MTKVVATKDKDKYEEPWKTKFDDYNTKHENWLSEQKYYMSSKVVKWTNVRPFSSKEAIQDSGEKYKENASSTKGEKNGDDSKKMHTTTRELLHGFCESTTAHGWAHVVRSTSNIYNRLWLLVTLCAISGAGVHFYHLTNSYLE